MNMLCLQGGPFWLVLHVTRFAFFGWPVECKSRFGGTTCEDGFGTQLQMPVWCIIKDHKDWYAFFLDCMHPICSLVQSELPRVVMTVVEAKVPLVQRLARLGFHCITVTIINRWLKQVPKQFLKLSHALHRKRFVPWLHGPRFGTLWEILKRYAGVGGALFPYIYIYMESF